MLHLFEQVVEKVDFFKCLHRNILANCPVILHHHIVLDKNKANLYLDLCRYSVRLASTEVSLLVRGLVLERCQIKSDTRTQGLKGLDNHYRQNTVLPMDVT